MPPDLASFGIDKLDAGQRLALMEAIWESLDKEEPSHYLTPGQLTDLESRIEAADADPDAGKPWAQLKAELKRRA